MWKEIIYSVQYSFLLSLWYKGLRHDEQLAMPLWQAIVESFVNPVMQEVRGDRCAGKMLKWWLYDDGWRSKRRVWWAAVSGIAKAREADWWLAKYQT
jgi:hypothetical protein